MLESNGKDIKAARAALWRKWRTSQKREREAADKEEQVRSSAAAAINAGPPISYWRLWRCGLDPAQHNTCQGTC